jgi:imidazolonepropionase
MSSPAQAATLLVRGIGTLVTCTPADDPASGGIRDACVVADGAGIVYAGAEASMPALTPREGFAELDAGGAAVIPGFVDAHTHAIWMGSRAAEFARRAAGESYEEIARQGGGIRATVRATAAATVDELVAAARPRLGDMLRSGTTTVEVKSGYGLELEAELRMLEAAELLGADASLPDVVRTWLPLHSVPSGNRREFLDDVLRRGIAEARPHATFVDAFCEEGAFSVAECGQVLRVAAERGLVPKLHTEQRTRSGGALLAAELGAASADHLEHAADSDLRALGKAGVVGVLLPGAALVLGGPRPPGRRALEAGMTIAVATDCNPGTCYAESMPLMVALAVATAGLTPAQALHASTAGGARALRLWDRGSIARGMRCDLCVLNSGDWIDVAYHLGVNPVRTVVRAGRIA